MIKRLYNHFKSVNIWIKALYISLIVAILWTLLAGFLYLGTTIRHNTTGIYDCGLSLGSAPQHPCGLFQFIFKSVLSTLVLISGGLVFILSYILSILTCLIIRTYKKIRS